MFKQPPAPGIMPMMLGSYLKALCRFFSLTAFYPAYPADPALPRFLLLIALYLAFSRLLRVIALYFAFFCFRALHRFLSLTALYPSYRALSRPLPLIALSPLSPAYHPKPSLSPAYWALTRFSLFASFPFPPAYVNISYRFCLAYIISIFIPLLF